MECEPGVNELPPRGRLEYRPRFLARSDAVKLQERLEQSLQWRQRSIRMFGRDIPQPRLIAWYGTPGVRYTYSGRTLEAAGWQPDLERLAGILTDHCGTGFNSVLCNLYRDGRDSMGWHSDDEPELGRHPVIASVSLGGLRRFVLRRRDDHSVRVELVPEPGSLIVMSGDIQAYWQHAVPRTARSVEPRINLTFRRITG